MKLKKNIYSTNKEFHKKFENCKPNKLKQGDYIRLFFLAYNQKRRGGDNFRINQQTVILQKKKQHRNTCSILVTALYKKEHVKWRYLVTSPHMVKVLFLKRNE